MENKPDISSGNHPKWIFLPLVLVPVILFLPALIPGKSLFWGITSIQFIPWHWAALNDIQQGMLPLWNTLNGLGAPLAANYQSALFYPPTWLIMIAGWIGGITWLAWAHGFVIVLHLIWAGLGMKSLTAFLGLSSVPQLISGLAYGMCGYLVARGGFLTMVQAAAWIPWILLAASQLALPFKFNSTGGKGNKTKYVIWLSLAFSGQWLSGHAQIAWYTILFCCAWLFYGAIINGGVKHLFKIMLLTLAAGVIGFLISSIQLIPTIEYFMQSQRSAVIDHQTALSYSFWPWRVITFLLPDFFGNPGRGDHWGYSNYWEDAVYFGLLPMFFAFIFLFKRGKNLPSELQEKVKPFFWFAGSSIVIAFVLALGWHTPIYLWLFDHIPTFGLFNGPARWMILVEVCLVLVAGFGAEEWVHHTVLNKKQVNILLTISFAGITSAIGAWFILSNVNQTFATSLMACGIFLLGYLILSKFKPETGKLIIWQMVIVGWFSLDLIWAGFFLNPVISSSLYQAQNNTYDIPANFSGERYYWNNRLENDQRFKRFFSFKDIRPTADTYTLRDTYLANINILSNIATLNNFDPMVPERFSTFINELETSPEDIRERYLELASVGKSASLVNGDIRKIKWDLINAKPEVRLIPCATITKNGDESLSWIRTAAKENKFDTHVSIESDSEKQLECTSSGDSGNQNLVTSNLDKGLVIETNAITSSQWLVISRTWYPGWQARIDGADTEIFRANYLFTALEVPAGSHKIEFFYKPVSFQIGRYLSICGILIVMIGGFVSRRFVEVPFEG